MLTSPENLLRSICSSSCSVTCITCWAAFSLFAMTTSRRFKYVPQFWGHWAFIYSSYCSYSLLIHNDVLSTTWHVSEKRKLFDVGEIFFFYYQRRNKTLGTKIMSAWWFIFIDEGRFLSITTEQPDTSFNILCSQWNFSYKKHVPVNNFLKAVNSLGTLRVKVENSI